MNLLSTTTPGLEFDEEKHRYSLNGAWVPGVTGILQARGLVEGAEYFTPEGRDRGRAVHSAIHLIKMDMLDWETVDDRIRPYIEAYLLFIAESGFRSMLSEEPLGHKLLRYAGTPDDRGLLNALTTLADFKTGAMAKCQPVQLAAYDELDRHNGVSTPEDHIVVLLQRDCTYRIKRFSDYKTTLAAARTAWLAALNLTHYMGERAYENVC